jgi:hypothetical protein
VHVPRRDIDHERMRRPARPARHGGVLLSNRWGADLAVQTLPQHLADELLDVSAIQGSGCGGHHDATKYAKDSKICQIKSPVIVYRPK